MLNSRQKDWIQSQGGALLMIKGDTKKFKKHFDSRRNTLQTYGLPFVVSFTQLLSMNSSVQERSSYPCHQSKMCHAVHLYALHRHSKLHK